MMRIRITATIAISTRPTSSYRRIEITAICAGRAMNAVPATADAAAKTVHTMRLRGRPWICCIGKIGTGDNCRSPRGANLCRSPRRGANSIPNFAARRGGAPNMPVSKNDAIFCNPLYWIAKNGIVFAYGFVPFNSSNWGRGELQFSISLKLGINVAAASGNNRMQKMASFSLTQFPISKKLKIEAAASGNYKSTCII